MRVRSQAFVSLTALLIFQLALPALAGHHEKAEGGQDAENAAKAEGGQDAENAAKAGGGQDAENAAKAGAAKRPAPAIDPLMRPQLARETAPEQFQARFETTQGEIVLQVERAWSPHGADRFYNLVRLGFYDDVAFFRVIPGFMAQFGMSGDPKVTRAWQRATLRDDPVVESNVRGMLSFAKTGRPNSRTTQLFINLSDNKNLDQSGFSPFARVIEGMDVVDRIYKVGEGAPRGPGPSQQSIKRQGNAYLKEQFPKLDYIERATITE